MASLRIQHAFLGATDQEKFEPTPSHDCDYFIKHTLSQQARAPLWVRACCRFSLTIGGCSSASTYSFVGA